MQKVLLIILAIVICVVGGGAYIGYSAYRAIMASGGCINCFQIIGSGPMITGSGHVATETRKVTSFTSIALDSPANVMIEHTGTLSVSVTSDDNLLPYFTSEVKDSTLHLAVAPDKSFQGRSYPLYRITVADLRDIELHGSGDIRADKLDGPGVTLGVIGSGDVRLAGRVDDFALSLKGSGHVDASKLQAKRAKVDMSGSGDATVDASDTLDVHLRGSGDLRYVGTPKVTQDVSGSGRIQKQP